MPIKVRFSDLLVSLLCLQAVGCDVEKSNGHGHNRSTLAVKEADLFLGRLWASGLTPARLRIQNVSSSIVEVVGFKQSCDCFEIKPSSFSVLPGESRSLSLVFDFRSSVNFADATPVSFDIIPRFRGSEQLSDVWSVRGTVSNLLELSSSFVRFTGPLLKGQSVPCKDINISSSVPLQALNVEGCEEIAILSISEKTSTDYTLRIQLRGDVPRSTPFKCEVVLLPKLEDGSEVRVRGPTLIGQMPAEFSVSPSQVHLGFVKIHSEFKQVLSVRSADGEAFQVTSLIEDLTGKEQAAQWKVAAASDGHAIVELLHKVSRTGEQLLNLTVNVRGENGNVNSIIVPIHYVGIQSED